MDELNISRIIVLHLITALLSVFLGCLWLRIVGGPKLRKKLFKTLKNQKFLRKNAPIVFGWILIFVVFFSLPSIYSRSLDGAMIWGAVFGYLVGSRIASEHKFFKHQTNSFGKFRSIAFIMFMGWALATLVYNTYAAIYF